MVRSPEQDTNFFSIGENNNFHILRLCPFRVDINVKSFELYNFISLSCDPDATIRSFGDIANVLISLS